MVQAAAAAMMQAAAAPMEVIPRRQSEEEGGFCVGSIGPIRAFLTHFLLYLIYSKISSPFADPKHVKRKKNCQKL